ncbi:CzcE family metal-binding protein [Cupriavidus ulmosensis]
MAEAGAATPLGPQAALFGSLAPANTTSRAVTLGPGLKSVNVASGDTVTFRSGAQEATWTFAEFVHGSSVDLGICTRRCPTPGAYASISSAASSIPAAEDPRLSGVPT